MEDTTLTALIVAHDRNGKVAGKCDEKCYNATSDRCLCVCGGMNHGVGPRVAASNTRIRAAEILQNLENWATDRQTKLTFFAKLSCLAHPTLFPTELESCRLARPEKLSYKS